MLEIQNPAGRVDRGGTALGRIRRHGPSERSTEEGEGWAGHLQALLGRRCVPIFPILSNDRM